MATVGLGVCLLAFVGASALVLSPEVRNRLGVGGGPPDAYAVGDRIGVSPDIYTGAPLTLLVFGRSTCSACEASVAAYHEAVNIARQRNIPAWFLTPLIDLDPERIFAQRLGIDVQRVLHVSPASARLQTVPALILVNRHGIVQHVWMSRPDESRRLEILRTLGDAGDTLE